MRSIAAGIVSHADGSNVPCQSCVGERAVGAVAPRDDHRLDPAVMLRPRPEEARSLRRAEPLVAVAGVDVGAERLEVERQLARARGRRRRPRARLPRRAAAQISATGSTSAVGDVTWLTETRPSSAARSRRRAPPAPRTTSCAPTNSHVRVTAPYSCRGGQHLVAGPSRSERMTAFSPEVELCTKREIRGRAPTKAASAARTAVRRSEPAPEEVGRAPLELALPALLARRPRHAGKRRSCRGSGA